MRNVRSFDDLTPEEQEEVFFAVRKEPVGFVQMTGETVVIGHDGARRIDNYNNYFIGINSDGSVFYISHDQFEKNFVEMDYISQQFMDKTFLKGNK